MSKLSAISSPGVLPTGFIRALVVVSFLLAVSAHAKAQSGSQTTVTISNTIEISGIGRPGLNLGGLTPYGPQQLLKSLNYANGGYMPGIYAATTYQCSSGGTNTTTSWYNNITNPAGYPANFWVGATFLAIDAATGTSYGSGTITASTANTGASGITFTLSPPLSSVCSPSQNDVLIVRLTDQNTLLPPSHVAAGICPGATWNTTDTSPASSNTQQSLQMPNGCSASFAIDAVLRDATNPNSTRAAQSVPWINLNGSYTATFKAKCLVNGCIISYSLARVGGSIYIDGTTVSPSSSPTPKVGWTTYTRNFTSSETGSQGSSLEYVINCSGTCLLQDADVLEGSTLPGNTTVFRDAVVFELEKIHPGSLRYMDGTQWCSDVTDEIAATGNRRWCLGNEYLPSLYGPPLGYNDVLALANLIGSDAFISVGVLNQPSDWTTLVNWLSSSGWVSTFAASGHKIFLEDGNEAWNSAAPASLYHGNGLAYGHTLGLNLAAAKAASGYNSSVIKLVSDGWVAGEQGYGLYGWLALSMQAAGCTLATKTTCPDFVGDAPYLLNYLGTYDSSGSNVATTGAPFLDEWAESANIDSDTSPPAHSTSMYLNQQYTKSTYGLNTLVYEVNESTTAGIPVTQLQLDQIDASVGNALSTVQHILLMQRDSHVTGPIHVFTLAEPYNSYNGAISGVVMPLWGTSVAMATGPGQTPGTANVDRPLAIALEIINNAIGTKSNLMAVTQTGTPTFSYPGGQAQASSNTISSNSAVPYVNCFAYADSAQTDWTTICFNNNLSSVESVTFAGPGAPAGAVTQTIFPNPGNLITDHNENSYVGPSSAGPTVILPSPTARCATSYSIPPSSMVVLSYAVGSSSATLARPTFSPGAGTYSGTQTVTIGFPANSTGCVGINTTPTAPTTGTCGSGGVVYTGPLTIKASETVNAIATEAGCTNSGTATAAYIITMPTVATPTFSPAAGTYTTSQSVAISDATPGATIHYTINGSVPTTSSAVYSGPITVSTSETLKAMAFENGYTSSPTGVATYTINLPQAATPTFSPPGGTYSAAQSVMISDATQGVIIYYTSDGTTPTTNSAAYSGPVNVSVSETLRALATARNGSGGTAYSPSGVGVAAYTISRPPPTFTIALSPISLDLTAGQSGTAKVLVTPVNSFASPISFSCSGLPAGAVCSFSPATVTPSGSTAVTTMTISTSPTTPALLKESSAMVPYSLSAVAIFLLGRKMRSRMMPLLFASLGLGLCTGCSSSSTQKPAPQPSISTVTITAAGGSLSQTATLTLTLN